MSAEGENVVQKENVPHNYVTLREDSVQTETSEEVPVNVTFNDVGFFHPSRFPYKMVVLFFICFLAFGSYFCYDNPAALQKQIITSMDINMSDFTLLYSVYSWPNVILAFFGGFLIDAVMGIRLGAIIFSLFIALGQVVFALGGFVNMFWLMVLGRVIFGLGGENLGVCQNLYSALWYKGSMLNMVFGIQLSIARLGSSVNMWTMQSLYDSVHPAGSDSPAYVSVGITLFIGGIICFLSFFCAVALAILDRHAKKVLKRSERHTKPTCADLAKIIEVRHFPMQMWLICGICVFYYVSVFPFVSIAQTFYVMKYSFDVGAANTANSLVYLVSLVASPIFGFLIDRTGKNIFWILLGCLLTTLAHGMLAFTFINPYVNTFLLGLSYSCLASSLWPLVAYAVPEEKLGTAFGVMQAVQNIGLAVMPLIAGIIVDGKGYLILEVIFLLCLFLSISCTLLLWVVDGGRGGELNMTPSERRSVEEEKKKTA